MIVGGSILVAQIVGLAAAVAGPWEDGMAAYNRGDYVPAIRLFRPLAEQGNPKAQNLLGVMYRRGHGVKPDSVRAFLWFTRAAGSGDAKAKTELRALSRSMTPEALSRAREMTGRARPQTTGRVNIETVDNR